MSVYKYICPLFFSNVIYDVRLSSLCCNHVDLDYQLIKFLQLKQ